MEDAERSARLLRILERLGSGELSPEDRDSEDATIQRGVSAAKRALERSARPVWQDPLFLERILEHLPVMLFVKDARDLRFVRFNRAGEELLGYSRQDLLGKSDIDFFPPSEAAHFIAKDREVLASRVLLDIPEEPIHTATGERWLHTRKIPILGEDGEPVFLLGISEDITNRKGAEAALRRVELELREQDAWLRVVLKAFPGAVWTVDGNLRVTSVAGLRAQELGLDGLVGGSVASLPDPTFHELLDPSSVVHSPTLHDLHRAALRGSPISYEFSRHGRSYEVRIEALVTEQRAGVIGIAHDVTERRRLEEERVEARMQQAQKLESLGLLAGGIAHDFNNLLVGMLGNASLALADLPPNSPVRPSIERMESAAERAADLTRQMLAYSGRGRFVVEPVDLGVVVQEMAQLLETSISKRARLRFELDVGLPFVEADLTQIRQVVMNLITNASNALGEGHGTVRVVTARRRIEAADVATLRTDAGELVAGFYVTLEVADNGRGMDAEVRRRMFDPFFTTRHDGHGLGLAAVLGIIRGHRGAIAVESEPGVGTSVTVYLPESSVSTSQMIPTLVHFDEGPGGRVLVVDDEPAVRALATAALQRAGYTVQTACDGAEGLRLFREAPEEYGVVLLDLTMPVMDGEEAFAALRAVRPGVRVLLSSGFTGQEVTSRFAGEGLAGFLQKPYRAGDLVSKVQELFEASGPHELD